MIMWLTRPQRWQAPLLVLKTIAKWRNLMFCRIYSDLVFLVVNPMCLLFPKVRSTTSGLLWPPSKAQQTLSRNSRSCLDGDWWWLVTAAHLRTGSKSRRFSYFGRTEINPSLQFECGYLTLTSLIFGFNDRNVSFMQCSGCSVSECWNAEGVALQIGQFAALQKLRPKELRLSLCDPGTYTYF